MAGQNPIDGIQVDLAEVKFWGNSLQRPECVVIEPDGPCWSTDLRGLVHIRSGGKQRIIEVPLR